jgi:C-terminal processing protease CtpA/Prc
MPQFNSGNEAWDTYFADTLQGLIRALDRPGLKGWVLDLRGNMGGNCWPMLAGIGPILGSGVCGYFGADADRSDWSIAEGRSLMDDSVQCAVSRTPYALLAPDPRVAVITGPSTASSGEVVAVAFRARPGTRSFGAPTAGYSTTNTNFELSDGAMLFLATSVYVDRAMKAYGAELQPDELISVSKEGDAPLERAVQWLRGR